MAASGEFYHNYHSAAEILSADFERKAKPVRSKKMLDYIISQLQKEPAQFAVLEIYLRIVNKTRLLSRRIYFTEALIKMLQRKSESAMAVQIEKHLKLLLEKKSGAAGSKKDGGKNKKRKSFFKKVKKAKSFNNSSRYSGAEKKGSTISRIYGRPLGNNKPIYNSPKY